MPISSYHMQTVPVNNIFRGHDAGKESRSGPLPFSSTFWKPQRISGPAGAEEQGPAAAGVEEPMKLTGKMKSGRWTLASEKGQAIVFSDSTL